MNSPSLTIRSRWLALATDAFGGSGGIAQYNRDFLAAAIATGQASSIAVLVRHAPNLVVTPAGIRQETRQGRFAYALKALAHAFFQRVDVVFCGHLHMVVLARTIARMKGARLIVQVHGIEAWPCPSRPRRAALEAATFVLSVSRHTRARVIGWAAIAPERVLVLPNTVATGFTPGDGSALRAELGLEKRKVLLTVGRLDARERYKGQDRVIAAIPKLVAQGHDVAYAVVGEGGDWARLRVLAEEAGVAERVLFLGAVAPDRLADCYRMADLYVMPSTGEGFGIAFLEAMACGTPALAIDAGGAADALGDGELGAFVSADGLAAAIARLLSGPRREPRSLTEAVVSRFGPDAFRMRVHVALDRVAATA